MCEDPKRIYFTEEKPEQTSDSPIDLRGVYRPEGKREFFVENPEDLVINGIRIPEHAVLATPTWGENGLRRYRRALEASETMFDFSKTIED